MSIHAGAGNKKFAGVGKTIFSERASYGDLPADSGVGIVTFKTEIGIFEIKNGLHFRVQDHFRKLMRFAGELFSDLVEVVRVDMGVAKRMDKITWPEITDLRHHHCQECIACDIEGHTEEAIRTALI